MATPGRLLDLLKERAIDLSAVKTLVFDEADRMLDMGFIKDVKKIMRCLPQEGRQTLLFSATFSPAIRSLSRKFLSRPKMIQIERDNTPVKSISQVFYSVPKDKKENFFLI